MKKITDKQVTYIGAVVVVGGVIAFGRGWRKLGGGLMVGGIGIPFLLGRLSESFKSPKTAEEKRAELEKQQIEQLNGDWLAEKETQVERFKLIQENGKKTSEKGMALIRAAIRYPKLVELLKKPTWLDTKEAFKAEWSDEGAKAFARKFCNERRAVFLLGVPLDKVMWCYNNCWETDHSGKKEDPLALCLLRGFTSEELPCAVATITP